MKLARIFDSTAAPTEAHTALVLCSFVALVAFQGFALWRGQTFNVTDFGDSCAALIGGGGIAAVGQGVLSRLRGPARGKPEA